MLEISKLLEENGEIKKCENEFRHHMNNTIDRLQKEVQKWKSEFNYNSREWHNQIDRLQKIFNKKMTK